MPTRPPSWICIDSIRRGDTAAALDATESPLSIERAFFHAEIARDAERMAQIVDVIGQQRPPPLGDSDREETGAARHLDAAIIRHRRSIAFATTSHHRTTPHPTLRKIRWSAGWALRPPSPCVRHCMRRAEPGFT
jgi:hypothetical protein